MRTQSMYMEHEVYLRSPQTEGQRDTLDSLLGDEWRVFATHAVTDPDGNAAVIYVLVQDVELDDDDE